MLKVLFDDYRSCRSRFVTNQVWGLGRNNSPLKMILHIRVLTTEISKI
jgi:hypothetical protein